VTGHRPPRTEANADFTQFARVLPIVLHGEPAS